MNYLNMISGFHWATVPRVDGLSKVSIGGECFWLRSCCERPKRTLTDSMGTHRGIIDNILVCTDEHGLKYNNIVTFTPTQ